LAADVYRDRLARLAGEHEALRTSYNDAVRRSAVTELLVRDGSLSVLVRTPGPEGSALREIETPFDPSREIYVDFAVLDGRLWIRRVFDERTPPSLGVVIDPELAQIEWAGAPGSGVRVGKAVYRSLSEGRWVVSVTGQGSLGLERVGPASDAPGELIAAPTVQTFDELPEADRQAAEIGWSDIWRWLRGARD
jgi:hypothetical protein